MLSAKSCKTCGAWQRQEAKGECRKNSPVIGGWPQTIDTDWCLQWLKDERPRMPVVKEAEIWQIGVNYVFVRDYPEHVVAWLEAAQAVPGAIPEPLRPVLSDLFGAVLTEPLPDWLEDGECCEKILRWAEQLSCFCNDDTDAGENDYQGFLMSMETPADISANQTVLAEIPADHPLRKSSVVTKEIAQ